MADSDEHRLTREIVETYQYELEVIDWDDASFNPDGKEGLELTEDLDTKVAAGHEKRSTIECSCGERFRKDETAIQHLVDEGVIDPV